MESSTFESSSTSSGFISNRIFVNRNTTTLENISLDSSFAWLLCALFLAMSWVIYITYYNSRIIGYIITKIVNRFVKKGYIKLGSLSVSVLSGKIMFRDVAFINEDYTIRAQDGWLIFRWWYPYVHKEITEDFSHSDTRLSLLLNGFELHMYNRSQLYARLEHLFGLEPRMLSTRSDPYWQDSGSGDGETLNTVEQISEHQGYEWRDLIPVIKVDISTGRLVFGNRLVPTTLSIAFEEGHITYTTKPASSRLDKFTHIAKCKAENFKVILAPSPKYTGLSDEPPRFMGEGFVVLQSNLVDLYYYQDEPGNVSSEPEMIELANGDIVQKSTAPCWGLDIKCGKGTDFSYGPWADRQREQLYKFFFPQDYQPVVPTKKAEVGEKRLFHSFDIRLSTLAEATIDILFSKEKETNAIHMTTRPGSYLEITIPWIVEENGFSTKINGQLLHLEATTSLQYRTLVESETLEFDVQIQYPRIWNEYQDWTCNLTGCKATVQLIYAHKSFFQALIEDWSSKSRPDLLKFVPYTWHFNITLKEFELVLVANEHNWIDCSSQHQENSHIAICGELFDMSFNLPFIDFVPPTVSLEFWIQGESVDLSFYLPETNTNRDIVLTLQKNTKLTNREGSSLKKTDVDKKWRNLCKLSSGWVDCWSVPLVALSIAYTYHPVTPMGQQTDLDITTPEKEELLLSPIRPNGGRRCTKLPPSSEEFDPTSLASDVIHLELEFGSSVLCLYGALLSLIMHAKENYLGENQKFVDLESSLSPVTTPTGEVTQKSTPRKDNDEIKDFDPRNYRPLDVTVSLIMHDIQGHLLNNCTEQDPTCQCLYLERLAFELHKTYRETKLQLLLSPLILSTTDVFERPDSNAHLKNGHLAVAALQVRGDAMFSDAERSLDCETLEYAWLVEIQMGDITGRLTLPQLYNTVAAMEIFAFQVQQSDCALQPPTPYKFCHHEHVQTHCPESTPSYMCPSPEEMKYRMTRLSIDAIDICLTEANTAINLEIYPIRMATCNLHGLQTSSGLSTLISHIYLHQYSKISSNLVCSSAYSIASHGQNVQTNQSDIWLEVGSFTLGPIYIDAANSQLQKDKARQQEKFLQIHDFRTKRLWFLWSSEQLNNSTVSSAVGKCGCVGGCAFFGSNKNGIHFFHIQELQEDKGWNNLAKYHIFNDDNLGFGESLLHKGEYVFDIPKYSSHDDITINRTHSEESFVFTEGYMGHTSPKTPEIIQRNSLNKDQIIDKKDRISIGSNTENNTTASTLSISKTIQQNTTSESIQIRQNTWDSAVGAGIKNSLQNKRIMRQFSSPTHMSTANSPPSVLQLLNQSSNQCAVTSGNSSVDTVISKEQNVTNNNISSDKEEVKEEKYSECSNSLNSKERSNSPSPSQNRHSSRASLNGWSAGSRDTLGSRHSLANIASRGFSPRSVRRAVSTESTHSSDMYFSADEEALCSMLASDSANTDENGSESEKIRHISLKTNTSTIDRKIVANNRRSLHDIQELPSQQSSDSDQQTSKLQRTPSNSTHHDPSDSNSVSSMSFISAMSSQEDIALVDLHNQMDKPIIDSPLLMSCYNAHMSQYHCSQWNESPPPSHLSQQTGFTQCGPNRDHLFSRFSTRWKPKFSMITEGFTTIHMVDKSKVPGYGKQYSWNQKSTSEEFSPGSLHKEVDAKNNKNKSEEDMINGIPLCSTKTALIIKLKGDIHIMISPLMLESLKSFIDVITPTLAGLHPLTIVNHLHALCSHNVQQQNQLKKEKVLQLAQLRAQLLEKFGWKKDINDNEKCLSNTDIISGSNYEETRVTHLRSLIQISKVNISIIQAAIVEEVISFSALDNLKDLTCVSVLAVRFDNTSVQIFHSHHARKAIQTFADNTNTAGLHQKITEISSKKSKTDSLPTDMVTIETSETQQQETVFSVSISCVHIQLRRLKNSSTILKEAMLTVIPYHKSKVGFTFEKVCVLPKSNSMQSDKPDPHVEQEWDQLLDEEKMGFIMFECGLEDISLKFVKRLGFKNDIANQTKNKSDIHSKNSGHDINGQGTHNEHSPSKNSQKSDISGASWDTKVSFPSCISECGSHNSSDKETCVGDIKGDASSFVIELKTVWFNFAAPPRTPNTRKIDFTRLDWHLLSTASPAINAWLKPGDRILISTRKMIREYLQRIFTVVTCLMVEALDTPSIHMPVKSKYMVHKLTALSKTLQEDPSCQLLIVLRRYLKQTNIDTIEENLHPDFTPPVKILQRGIVALSRQWKNILYMPLLVEQNMKLRKNARPFGVSFTLPISELSHSFQEEGERTQLDECEVTDETTNLLMAEGGSVAVRGKTNATLDPVAKSFSSPDSGSRSSNSQQDLLEGGISTNSLTRKNKKKLPSYPPRTTRASVAFPLLGGPLDSPGRYAGGVGTSLGRTNGFILPQYGFINPTRLKRNDSHQSLKSTTWSLSSIEPNLPSSILGTPRRNFMDSGDHPVDEDLYNWMARQQDYVNNTGLLSNQKFLDHTEHDSKMNTLTSENSLEDEISKLYSFPPTMTFIPLGVQVADAHIIFQPLLSNLGIQNQSQDSLFYTNFGPKITLSGIVDLLKIDIVESEYQNSGRHKKKTARKQISTHGKFFIDTSMDTPTFICDKFSIELELRETRNFEKKDETDIQYAHAAFLLGTKSLKQITTIVNFNIVVNFIAQQVNMPLLRLLHQFSTMYENVKETRLELKANRPNSFKGSMKTGKKKCSSSIESQSESYRPHSPRPTLSSKFATPTKSTSGVTSLSVGIRRPQTLSQRLRASSKGYTNLQEMLSKDECPSSPLSFTLSDSVAIDIPESCSAPPSEHTFLEDIKDYQPRCWRTMFYLLDLYDTMPETKTVNERTNTTVPVTVVTEAKSPDVSEGYKGNGKYEPLKEHQIETEGINSIPEQNINQSVDPKKHAKDQLKNLKSLIVHDWVPLVVFGVARIRHTRLLAMLSGLKLEGELNGFHASITHRERVRGTSRKWSESSLTGQLGQTMVILSEGISPNQQTVVKITIGKSQALYSSQNRKGKGRNSALLTIGPINFDIPQHPVALHGMMTRSSRQLSTTLQELRATRQPSRTSRQIDEFGPTVTHSPQPPWDMTTHHRVNADAQELIKPIVIHFSIILDSLTIGAALLPSLCAQYQMGQVTSMGVTGSKAKFTVDLPQHTLSFNTKVPTSESNLPSSASVDLPPVHISAEYIQDSTNTNANKADSFTDGVVLCQGSYLSALAEIGSFEHSLTTDLLNHLVLVQKVFMKEVNEVVQKMSGVDKPVPLLGEEKLSSTSYTRRVLFSLLLRLKGIQITATTPTSSAVRLETGVVELQLSNRVQNMSSGSTQNGNNIKLFGKAQVDLNLALGQLIKNALFEEAEPEFQQFAYFKTRICMRNALQDEMITGQSEDKEAVLITLNRPLIYIQPVALDKAVLVWLNYKNAYEYWNEQRSTLNKEVLTATQQVFEKVPQISQLGSQALGTLFLQLTVDDMGICLPLNAHFGNISSNKIYDTELKAAVVVTLENTRVSACSCGSLVSKARFTGLCIRFADDFETSLDDWKPDPNDTNIMNLCVVSEGTYEICSRTIVSQGSGYSAKWILNVQWQMEGVDIHVDTNIGKQLSALFKTLTALTGEDEGDGVDYSTMEMQAGISAIAPEPVIIRKGSTFVESLPPFLLDPGLDAKKRSRLIEKEMNEQAKIINDLRLLGASQNTIEQEVRRLHELEAAVFNDFRRDVIKRLRRQSVKATSFRDKLGLGIRSSGAPLQSMSLFFPEGTNEKNGLLDSEPSPVSKESSPTHAHTRTASLDMSDLPNITINEKTSVHRELSLDSVFTSSLSAELCPSETPTPPSQGTDVGITNVSKSDSTSPSVENAPPKSLSSSSEAGTEQDFLNDDCSNKMINDLKRTGHATPGGTSSGMSSSKQPVAEPNIDFELDVKVFFNSGKCVLHTKDSFKELQDDQGSKKSMKKERSFSGGMVDLSSPSHNKKKHSSGMKNNASSSRLRYIQMPVAGQIADFTIFLIPGLDVKVHYNSKTIIGDSPVINATTCKVSGESETEQNENIQKSTLFPFEQGSSSVFKKGGVKKASLFAWMTLQSIPEETVISPHILDFLEQALEPIPIQLAKQPPLVSESSNVIFSNIKPETGSSSLAAPTQYAYASFPVDVIVYFRMQPSILRFSCLPVSRVECLLRLPSVDLVFSSKRAEEDLYAGSTTIQLDNMGNIKSKSPVPRRQSKIRPPVDSTVSQTAVGGLSMTGCLADFSLYIFHPYGGGKKSGTSGKESRETSPLTTSERKDSLSLQVEFVKVNISRSRKINLSHIESSASQKSNRNADSGGAVIRFSAICDIGSASFKYDMRRLTEILAFPKAWYRRSIARRMFLGDQSTGALYSDQEDSVETSSSSGTLSPSASRSECFPFNSSHISTSNRLSTGTTQIIEGSIAVASPIKTEVQLPLQTIDHPSNDMKLSDVGISSCPSDISASDISHPTIVSNIRKHSRDHLWLNLGNFVENSDYQSTNKLGGSNISFSESKESKSSQQSSTPLHIGRFGSTWETLVLFAVNLSKLSVHMNMGNVMGNTMWLTRDFKSQGRLSIGSTGHKNLYVSVGLEGSTLDSKGGIVGGTIELSQIDTCTHFKEDFGQEPDHTVAIKLSALESRLDYMGTSVLMGRVSSLDITVRDEWRVCQSSNQDSLSSHPTKRPALIYICSDLGWDQLQLIISKSTTPDLLKMYSKLEEFFSQQFHSSKRVFSSLQPRYQRYSIKSRSRRTKQTEEGEGRHHRHWQKVLKLASALHLNNLPCPLPRMGTILGGTIDLHGNNISLACYNGVNFRSKAWAIFSMREPNISFATESQDIINEQDSMGTHIIQNLSFKLGSNFAETAHHTSMATVCRISRNVLFPPQFRTMHEWFHYTFATSELDDVQRFPLLEHERNESSSSDRRASICTKIPEFNHSMEVIFKLPSLQLQLKTEHFQLAKGPSLTDPKPTVECSFVTEFDDHIFVAVDADAFFFLHDLITAYIKEKDVNYGKQQSPDSDRKCKVSDPTEALQKDWRNYQCHTWHLEPTVRLLSWGGKGIEPYGVDYILQKLGFAHARVTIPKWMQRGCMDPLDKILSIVMEKMLIAYREDKDEQVSGKR